MTISFRRIDPAGPGDRAELIDFMTSHEFPFHVRATPTREQVEAGIADGAYQDEDNDSSWIEHAEHGRIGFFRFEDLSDDAPLFDLRLGTRWRGKALAADVVHAATEYVFTTMPEVNRFEAQTREDNIAMRRTLLRCGWVKEAHHREGWPVDGAQPVASVAYAILRRDWVTGERTPVPWEDEPR